MFSNVRTEKPDIIMSVLAEFQNDQRADKLDLGIGVYRAPDGTTPVMATIREAQRIHAETETTKAYIGPLGDKKFSALMSALVLGEEAAMERISTIQTPGGSGALALGAALLSEQTGGGTILVPDPTWVNHTAIFRAARLDIKTYPYFDPATGQVKLQEMLASLEKAEAGSIVVLHACCHNPTGADLDHEGWRAVAELIGRRGLLPFVDLAYQGLGDGLEEDAFGVRHLIEHLPEVLVAVSCSKNFAIYRERTGLLLAAAKNQAETAKVQARLIYHARGTYSMPPDHGAAIVRTILEDTKLTAKWKSELDEMRDRIMSLRTSVADAFRARTNSDRFDFLGTNKGMFSLLGATPEQAQALRAKHKIYIIDDGRMNIAGLRHDQIDRFVEAVVSEISAS